MEKFVPYTGEYILGGGTALALQLAHRKSFDFDFFYSSPIPKNFLEKLSEVLEISTISVDSSEELTFFTKDEIKLTFLYYPFGYAFPLITLENGLTLFPVKDIAIKKAYTIGRRGEYRDYFDLYAILNSGYIDLLSLSRKQKKSTEVFLRRRYFFSS